MSRITAGVLCLALASCNPEVSGPPGGPGGGGGDNGGGGGGSGGGGGGGGGSGDPGTCAEAAASKSYIGCDYWPTVTPNGVWDPFDFAVVVANSGSSSASVTITGPNG